MITRRLLLTPLFRTPGLSRATKIYRYMSSPNQPPQEPENGQEKKLSGFQKIEKLRELRELRKGSQSDPKSSQMMQLKDYKMLTKFELSILNTFVALSGFLMVPSTSLLSLDTLIFCTATQMMAMSSQAFNQIIERDFDKQMSRTCLRPIPKNKISVRKAFAFTMGLYLTSNSLYLLYFPTPAFLVANLIMYSYLFVYTPLKRKSETNTHFGSIVGALPPVLGWVGAGGSPLDIQCLGLFSFLYAWQYPHFYGILWTYRDDYDKNGYKMVRDPKQATKIMYGCFVTQILSTIVLTYAGSFSYVGLAVMAPMFYKYSYKTIRDFDVECSIENAKKLKRGAYLPFLVFFLIILMNVAGVTPEQLYQRHVRFVEEEAKKLENEKSEFGDSIEDQNPEVKELIDTIISAAYQDSGKDYEQQQQQQSSPNNPSSDKQLKQKISKIKTQQGGSNVKPQLRIGLFKLSIFEQYVSLQQFIHSQTFKDIIRDKIQKN